MLRNLTYSMLGLSSTAELLTSLRASTAGVKYDTIIGTGISGALVIPAIGRAARKSWALIRKDGTRSHANGQHFEGEIGDRFIIVDDFVNTGKTVVDILRKVTLAHVEMGGYQPKPIFVGVWQYDRPTTESFITAATLAGLFNYPSGRREAINEYITSTEPRPSGEPQANSASAFGTLADCTCNWCEKNRHQS
jgi:hypothetical protein